MSSASKRALLPSPLPDATRNKSSAPALRLDVPQSPPQSPHLAQGQGQAQGHHHRQSLSPSATPILDPRTSRNLHLHQTTSSSSFSSHHQNLQHLHLHQHQPLPHHQSHESQSLHVPFAPFFTLISTTSTPQPLSGATGGPASGTTTTTTTTTTTSAPTPEYHHPTVHYIFSDDEDSDLVTEAALVTLAQQQQQQEDPGATSDAEDAAGGTTTAPTSKSRAVLDRRKLQQRNETGSTTEEASSEAEVDDEGDSSLSRVNTIQKQKDGGATVKERFIVLDVMPNTLSPGGGGASGGQQQQQQDVNPQPPPTHSAAAPPFTIKSAHSLDPTFQVLSTSLTPAPTFDHDPGTEPSSCASPGGGWMLNITGATNATTASSDEARRATERRGVPDGGKGVGHLGVGGAVTVEGLEKLAERFEREMSVLRNVAGRDLPLVEMEKEGILKEEDGGGDEDVGADGGIGGAAGHEDYREE